MDEELNIKEKTYDNSLHVTPITDFAGMEVVECNNDACKKENIFFLKKDGLYLVIKYGVVYDWFVSNENSDPYEVWECRKKLKNIKDA